MMLSERRRALMAGGGGSWTRALSVLYDFTYEEMGVHDQYPCYIFIDFPISKLTGEDSEYAIRIHSNLAQYEGYPVTEIPVVKVVIVPRDDPNSTGIPVKLERQGSETIGDSADIYCDGNVGYWNAPGLLGSGLLSIDPNSDAEYDITVVCWQPSGGGSSGEDECPSGGSHDFSTAGQPAYPLPNYPCPSCGQTGFCAQQYMQCTKCGAMSEYVRCQNCGWQSG